MNKINVISAIKVLTISYLMLSCNTKSYQENAETVDATEAIAATDSIMVIPTNPNISKNEATKNKQFIRTAESKFRVKDVKKATQKIQDATDKYGGYVTNMNLKSESISKKTIQISEDSLAEIATFSVYNDLTIRVPNQQLDSLLREVFRTVDYWDNCEIKADEVTLSLLAKSLKIKRLEDFSDRNKSNIDKKKGNISVATDAEENVLQHQNQADDYRIEQQNIADQVNFSTINLHIYQAQSTQIIKLLNPKTIEAYHPNIFLRLWDSTKDGWKVLEELLVFLFKFWVLFVVAGLAYFFLKKYRK